MDVLLERLLARFSDDRLDEILLNGTRGMFLSARDRREGEASPFSAIPAMIRWIQEVALSSGVRLDPLEPAAGGVLENGRFRWHAVLPPVAGDGPVVSLRRHRLAELSVDDFDIAAADRAVIDEAMRAGRSVILAGATGSGKTSLLTALLRERAANERVVILEDIAEIPAVSPAWVCLRARRAGVEGTGGFSLGRLLAESLRLRPERLVIGEIRGDEAPAFLQAMVSGHGGCMATIHAGGADEVADRMEFLSRGSMPGAGEMTRRLFAEGRLVCVVTRRGTPPGAAVAR